MTDDLSTRELIALNALGAYGVERAWAEHELRQGRTVTYCRGPGWPVLVLSTLDDWERRDALSAVLANGRAGATSPTAGDPCHGPPCRRPGSTNWPPRSSAQAT